MLEVTSSCHYRTYLSFLSLSRPQICEKIRIDYHQWQILSLMPLVVSFLLSFSFAKFIKITAVILARAGDSLRTFSACRAFSTSGSNYFARELRLLAARLSVFRSMIAQNSSGAVRESTFFCVRFLHSINFTVGYRCALARSRVRRLQASKSSSRLSKQLFVRRL